MLKMKPLIHSTLLRDAPPMLPFLNTKLIYFFAVLHITAEGVC